MLNILARRAAGIPSFVAFGLISIGSISALEATEAPRLGPMESRFTQEKLFLSQDDLVGVRHAGLTIFATQFNHADGFGDGPMNVEDPISPGGRPTLGNNGTYLRINGLDGQSCADCHSMVSSQTMPVRFGIGGFGGINDTPILQPTVLDITDSAASGFAFMDGRLIVPPHLFGSGAIQLLAEEMSAELQAIGDRARRNPGQTYPLVTKGISFGAARLNAVGQLDRSLLDGVDPDLIIKPFGRKGEFATVGDFDSGAMGFHFGMKQLILSERMWMATAMVWSTNY